MIHQSWQLSLCADIVRKMPDLGSSNHQDLRADIKIKDDIESEIAAIDDYLKARTHSSLLVSRPPTLAALTVAVWQSNGVPGLHGGLVDAEGFPRADIDVHAIRGSRQRLACASSLE